MVETIDLGCIHDNVVEAVKVLVVLALQIGRGLDFLLGPKYAPVVIISMADS